MYKIWCFRNSKIYSHEDVWPCFRHKFKNIEADSGFLFIPPDFSRFFARYFWYFPLSRRALARIIFSYSLQSRSEQKVVFFSLVILIEFQENSVHSLRFGPLTGKTKRISVVETVLIKAPRSQAHWRAITIYCFYLSQVSQEGKS